MERMQQEEMTMHSKVDKTGFYKSNTSGVLQRELKFYFTEMNKHQHLANLLNICAATNDFNGMKKKKVSAILSLL